jgi:hypothetical protein
MKILVLFFVTIPVISFGQIFNVDFEDNDLTGSHQNNPFRWEITSLDPVGGTLSLHHAFDNDQSGTDWITFFHQPMDLRASETTWKFSIRYDHNPSSSNNWSVFLASSDLPYTETGIENALIFGVNFRGSDDKLSLWKLSNGNVECIYKSDFNWEEKIHTGNKVSLKIERDVTGMYSISADTLGTGYFFIGKTMVSQIYEANFFTLYYKYTSTYDRGLSFDDLKITGKFEKDLVPPSGVSINVLGPEQLEVNFDKIVQFSMLKEFCVDGSGCGVPDIEIGRSFIVSLPHQLTPGNPYILRIPELTDMLDNTISIDNRNIGFYYSGVYDVVINEIMADPEPVVKLPGVEYIELYNRTENNISLKNWHLTINKSVCILPEFKLNANQYAVICSRDSADRFKSHNNNTLGIENFPAINNEQCEIILSDPSNRLIHSVNYSNNCYKSTNKIKGGWSVELINSNNPCEYYENWEESIDSKGGTPGYSNSIMNNNLENEPPKLYRAAITDSGSLILYFSEPMDSNSLGGYNCYLVDHDIGQPNRIIPSWPLANQAELFFDKEFKPLVNYEISLSYDITDCIGNTFSETQRINFEKSEQSDSAEMIINEIMFNPLHEHFEYIELYNNSEKTIDIRNWMISFADTSAKNKTITSDYFPVSPDNYVILVKNSSGFETGFKNKMGDKIVFMDDFPQLTDEGSVVYLYNNYKQVIDAAIYSPDDHHLLLQNSQGVSLERISYQISGLDPDNWQSASSDAGYMTPAAINSQHINTDPENIINIEPAVITPDADGTDDEITISYKLAGPGYMGRILIFDVSGNLKHTIMNGGILGTEGNFVFNGKNETGQILETGYYILFFDAFKKDCKRFTVKKAFVVASLK